MKPKHATSVFVLFCFVLFSFLLVFSKYSKSPLCFLGYPDANTARAWLQDLRKFAVTV